MKVKPARTLAAAVMLFCLMAASGTAHAQKHFVPNNIDFWYDSTHWTTNFGPAFRDTIPGDSYMLPCSGQFALCFHSGAEPFPCKLTPDGKYANCTCTVQTSTNYVLMTAILNYSDYQNTVTTCGSDGSGCSPVRQRAGLLALDQGQADSGRPGDFDVRQRIATADHRCNCDGNQRDNGLRRSLCGLHDGPLQAQERR